MLITKKLVPNFGPSNKPIGTKGRDGWSPTVVVVHIADGSAVGSFEEFSNPEKLKSAHYMVLRNGEIHQFVDEENCAWANGSVAHPTAAVILARRDLNPNLFTVSVEHEDFATDYITEAQYAATSELLYDICQRWKIPVDREHIIGHREINANKRCPEKIDVDRLVQLAIGVPIRRKQLATLYEKLIALYRQLISFLKRSP